MKRKIIILTGYNRFFGQTRKPWVSLNTEMLISRLKSMSIEVDEHPFHQVANSLIEVKNSIVFYTFSQKENLRGYIRDAMFALINNGNTIIPSYKLLLCHENKGYQEHLKKELGITNLPAWYFSSQSDLTDYNLEFPLVLKTLEGSNGKGVFLVKSETHLVELLNKINGSLSLAQKADLIRRRYLRLPKKFHGYSDFDIKKDYKEYRDYIKPEKGFILQKFIPGLEYDYRITVLGDKYYVTRRLNRKGDFRASGAKRFNFDFHASDALLDYARDIYERFDTPCLSVDIGSRDGDFYLFEYQALHFGINVIIKGNGFYRHSSQGWEFIDDKTFFEHALADALIYHLETRKLV